MTQPSGPVTMPRASMAGTGLFVCAIVLSAALLFSVEPMVTKMVLPRFGGSASVWSVAIVFFQGALLAGYLYAHVLTRFLPPARAALVHLAVLGLAATFLPLGVPQAIGGAGQAGDLLIVLAGSVGLPFMALSASAPLLQAWYARSGLPGNANPYPLYAASNAGSLIALLAYPLIIEPFAALRPQALGWSMGYAAVMLLIGAAGWLARGGQGDGASARAPLDYRRLSVWIALSAIPSAALVAVTAHISTDVAAAPFLWVAPLALYLLTFVIAFGRGSAGLVAGAQRILPVVLVVMACVVGFGLRLGLAADMLLHLGGFFLLALALHGWLVAVRPVTADLTAFYLAMSFGGMVGGILAALAAPVLFSFVAEYPLVILAAALALPRHRWPVAAIVATVMIAGQVVPLNVASRQTSRSFFGVHTVEVTRDGQFRTLRHGLEIHGAQRIARADGTLLTGKPQPLAYYHEESPISEAIDAARASRSGGAIRIGVVGLGTGSIACLAEPVDALDFYEIDPVVVAIAQDVAKFTFLSQCAPGARIIPGDARQTLAANTANYDILIIDAFSSDAIPAHLLTAEALDVYLARLAPQGMVLLHISNNHLRLQDIVAATARMRGLELRLHDEDGEEDAARTFIYQPMVMALARTPAGFGVLADSDDWTIPPVDSTTRPWTDDYSNLLGALIAKLREH